MLAVAVIVRAIKCVWSRRVEGCAHGRSCIVIRSKRGWVTFAEYNRVGLKVITYKRRDGIW